MGAINTNSINNFSNIIPKSNRQANPSSNTRGVHAVESISSFMNRSRDSVNISSSQSAPSVNYSRLGVVENRASLNSKLEELRKNYQQKVKEEIAIIEKRTLILKQGFSEMRQLVKEGEADPDIIYQKIEEARKRGNELCNEKEYDVFKERIEAMKQGYKEEFAAIEQAGYDKPDFYLRKADFHLFMASLHLSKSEELYEKVNICLLVCELGDKARLAAANKKAASLPEQLKQTIAIESSSEGVIRSDQPKQIKQPQVVQKNKKIEVATVISSRDGSINMQKIQNGIFEGYSDLNEEANIWLDRILSANRRNHHYMTVNRKIYNSTMIGERIIANLLAKRLASV